MINGRVIFGLQFSSKKRVRNPAHSRSPPCVLSDAARPDQTKSHRFSRQLAATAYFNARQSANQPSLFLW